jgi:hypothetical protein
VYRRREKIITSSVLDFDKERELVKCSIAFKDYKMRPKILELSLIMTRYCTFGAHLRLGAGQHSGPPRGGGGGEGGQIAPGPTLIEPQLESESLKLSRFFKLVRAFLKLRAPYSSSTCSLARVYFGD